MALSQKDSVLRGQVANFSAVLSASPATYAQSPDVAAAVAALVDAFVQAFDAMMLERANGIRSASATATKNSTRLEMLKALRPIYAYVQDSSTISDADKIALGVLVKKLHPTVPSVPDEAPDVDIVSVTGRTVKLRIHGAASAKRAKPAGCLSANLFSYVGETPPADPTLWRFEGGTTKVIFDVTLPASVQAGSQVWFVACWLNSRSEAGPGCDAVGTTLAGGSTTPMHLSLAQAA
jgi:hypothetical protein